MNFLEHAALREDLNKRNRDLSPTIAARCRIIGRGLTPVRTIKVAATVLTACGSLGFRPGKFGRRKYHDVAMPGKARDDSSVEFWSVASACIRVAHSTPD